MRTRRYETVFLVPADLEEGKLKEILDRLNAVLDRSGAVLVKREDWGVRKLAYEIERHSKGRYFLLDFAGSPKIISELERNIKMMESILRYLTVKKADEVDMEAIRKEQAEEREKEAAQRASARERAAAGEAEARTRTGKAGAEAAGSSTVAEGGEKSPPAGRGGGEAAGHGEGTSETK